MFGVTRWRLLLCAFVLCGAASGSCAWAQQQPGPEPGNTSGQTKTLTVNARLVVLDVVVTDKSGKPVDDLTRNDFKVFEDGKEQALRSFEAPSAHVLPSASLASGAGEVFDLAKPANFGQSPVTILVLDQLNTHFEDSSYARREIRSFLAARPAVLDQPTELLTVYDGKFRLMSGFTRDRSVLLKALDATPTEYAWNIETNGRTDYSPLMQLDQSLHALEQIAESAARVPGRKNLVWVGSGFPTVDPKLLTSHDNDEILNDIRHVTDTLLDTRVTVYAVDPSTLLPRTTDITDEMQMQFAMTAGDALAGSSGTVKTEEAFDHLGPATGGRVVRGMNNVAAQISDAVAMGGSFYTLSYSPTSQSNAPGRFRKIEVRCLRPGLTITTRNGYFNVRLEPESSPAAISYDLGAAAESNVPLTALRVIAHPAQNQGSTQTYVVRVGASSLTWTACDDGSSESHVEVLAASISAKGKMIGHVLHGMTATAKRGADLRSDSQEASFEFAVPADAKATVLRFVVRDAATGRMGSYDLPLAHAR